MASLNKHYKNQWDVASFTNGGDIYKVSEAHDGHWECSCKAWIFSGRGGKPRVECKHILATRNGLAQAVPVGTFARPGLAVTPPAEIVYGEWRIKRRVLDDVVVEVKVAEKPAERRVMETVDVQPINPEMDRTMTRQTVRAFGTPEELLVALTDALARIMASGKLEDLAAVCKSTQIFSQQLAEFRQSAMTQAQTKLTETAETRYITPFGTFMWTSPNQQRDPTIDGPRLLDAARRDPELLHTIKEYIKPGRPVARAFLLK